MATGQTQQDSLNQAASGVSSGAKTAGKAAKSGMNLAKKVKAGKAGASVAKNAGKKVTQNIGSLFFKKLKIYAIVIFVVLALLLALVTSLPMLIVNSLFHQSDPETLSDGRDFTYYGTPEEDFELLSETASRAKDYILGVFETGEQKALDSLQSAASASGWILDMEKYQGPTTQDDNESMVLIYSAYSASVKNGLSDESFEYYQETSAVEDLEEKLDGLTNKKSTVYPYGNQIHGADFLRNADGSVYVRTVAVYPEGTDSESGEDAEPTYEYYVTPIVHEVNIEEVSVAAFFPEGVTMLSLYEDPETAEEGEEIAPTNTATYGDIIRDMSISIGEMLFGEEFWDESDIFWGGIMGVPNDFIVNTALSQVGQSGGQPYWSWWPLSARVEWCAIFVSWCADQCGYLDAGIIPKFASCREGVAWFKARNAWHPRSSGYTPKAGDLIFFDWADEITGIRNGSPNHVGLVVITAGGKVYTVEGNSGAFPGKVREKSYSLTSLDILGYATPQYPEEDSPQEDVSVEEPAA